MFKAIAHVLAALATGLLLTAVLIWIAAGGATRSPLDDFITAHPAMADNTIVASMEAGDAWRGGTAAVYGPPGAQRAVVEIGGTIGPGFLYGSIQNLPVGDKAADQLLKNGALRGASRGALPAWVANEAARQARPGEAVFICYWGILVPITKASLTHAVAGPPAGAKGVYEVGGRFFPVSPVWPGFGLSVLILGLSGWGVLWLTILGVVRLARRWHTRLRPPLPPTVACKCGYTRKGLPSFEPCPECGHEGPRPIPDTRARQ